MSSTEPLEGEEAVARPLVAMPRSNKSLWFFGGGLLVAGAVLFSALESRRETLTAPSITAPADSSAGVIAAPPDLQLPPSDYPGYPGYAGYAPALPHLAGERSLVQPPFVVTPAPRPQGAPRRTEAAQPWSAAAPAPISPPPYQDIMGAQAPYQPPAPPAVPEPPALDGTSRTNGAERVEAARFANPATTVPKGTVVQAVLETALDSNKAGFARAIVSRDVMGFDGTRVLIPRGSRILGEYKADVALGQNRLLIQWQRLTRPDGIIIDLDSPSADPLGRAGVKGNVDTHFFQRFAGSILQTALDIGVLLATREASSGSIYVGVPGLTQGMVTPPEKIQPTVTVKQGKSVSVFVARDLDFTKVSQ